jgi:hypothetical protein
MSLARPIHYETHHSQSNPPPQMSTPNNPSGPPPYSFDAARASSLNAASPSNPYGTAPLPKARLKLCPKLTLLQARLMNLHHPLLDPKCLLHPLPRSSIFMHPSRSVHNTLPALAPTESFLD